VLAAKNARTIRSLHDLATDTFESDEELAEFLAFHLGRALTATSSDGPPFSPLRRSGSALRGILGKLRLADHRSQILRGAPYKLPTRFRLPEQ
jgi:hypothetical protein